MIVAYVALGGAIGAAARYMVVSIMGKWWGLSFPYGTLAVNIVGSLLMGVLIEWLARSLPHHMELRAFLAVGLLGGFTTFSAFSLDVVSLIEQGALPQAVGYVFVSVLGSIAALFGIIYLIRSIFN